MTSEFFQPNEHAKSFSVRIDEAGRGKQTGIRIYSESPDAFRLQIRVRKDKTVVISSAPMTYSQAEELIKALQSAQTQLIDRI